MPASGLYSSLMRLPAVCLLSFLVVGCGSPPPPPSTAPAAARSTRYEDVLTLFDDWREFQQPKRANGVPDYSLVAMATQHRDLAGYVNRLAAIDPSAWPVPQQVDYHVIRAEMNGLDFDHRVLRPWANNPAFYVTVFLDESDQPAREGPLAAGGVDVWKYAFPLSTTDAAEIRRGSRDRAWTRSSRQRRISLGVKRICGRTGRGRSRTRARRSPSWRRD